MSLLTQINEDMKVAMKAKDKETLTVIRMLKSAIQNEQIKLGADLNEDEELTLLAREMKQRRESLAEFENAGRDDLASKVKDEILIVERYMPAQLSEEELRSIVTDAIAKTSASNMKDIGRVMGIVVPLTKGKADGSHVSQIVKELLS